ncbi:hypothetical protein MPSEU_000702100 [Mayamaea pseudoterrestris]|nr:hypothetical protein MPSEU_000702100 [Mayamaea pseudoterrestris]
MISAKVVIIGAGACGLQCAHDLVTKHGVDPNEIIVLEARNRIGGRIHTSYETCIHQETHQPVDFAVDHGACWVHGTGLDWNAPVPHGSSIFLAPTTPDSSTVSTVSDSTTMTPLSSTASLSSSLTVNPIVSLLSQASEESVYEQLDKVFEGNPWMRPKTVVTDHNQLALYVSGRRIDNDGTTTRIMQAALQRHFDVLQAVSDAGRKLCYNGRGMETISQSAQNMIDALAIQNDITNEPGLSDNEQEIVSSLTPFFMHLVECWHGAPVKELQLAAFIADEDENSVPVSDASAYDSVYSSVGDFYGPHCNVKQGMAAVLEPLLIDGVRERIRLEQEVTKIRYNEEGRHLFIETASGLIVRTDACVSTLTVECLKAAIAENLFEPRLGGDKEEAISMTHMGSYKKVLLTFDNIFWPTNESFIGLVQSDPAREASPLGRFLLINNLWSRKGIPCLEAVLFGESGSWATGKSDDEIRTAVLKFIRSAMNLDETIDAQCLGVHVTRWEEDRFSRGAYSNMCLGASVRHVDELCQPEYDGRLILAGEGTILEYEGSVHAALISGRDAAEQLQAILTKESPDHSLAK